MHLDRAVVLLRRLPWLIRLEALGLCLALVTSLWVSLVVANADRRVADLSLPEVEDVVWDERVERFAGRLVAVFGVSQRQAPQYADWILDSAARHDLEPELLASVIYVESTFNRSARSPVGAVGPAQVMPRIWSRVCRGDLRDPATNIDCGAQILASYMDACGGQTCGLAHYNTGPNSRAVRAGSRYVAKVGRQVERLENFL